MQSGKGWVALARRQENIVTRAQLAAAGVDKRSVRRRIALGEWQALGPRVVMLAPGAPTELQRIRIGALYSCGPTSLAGRAALEAHGLKGWAEGPVVFFVGAGDRSARTPPEGITYVRTRHDLTALSVERAGTETLRVEPAALTLASALAAGSWGEHRSSRSAGGLVAAVVQQRLSTAESLLAWCDKLPRLRHKPLLRGFLDDIAGGSESMAEIDLVRTCRDFSLQPPVRQRRRSDSTGRTRYTDAEWDLPDGSTLVLEVDGAFHRTHTSWESDLRRQRRLAAPSRRELRCTAVELRTEPEEVVRDLIDAGVPQL
ncbi:hypothetical protein [Gordonia aichiensis]|uniref:DUF559 domain-containing protein n=1 Tax=Gordonia aichiensis NBRC 108223 TaxID=1220583 RepID=L7KJ04_9ACTN|nr:hypothetical protein [Gordonia aichiensis]GAC48865.1 hypothetical protein GOACH_07_01510 [Gordonia aichiensis NBRC 108223]